MKLHRLLESQSVVIGNCTWQQEWPTEPNTLWWFCGYPGKIREDSTPELILVQVIQSGSGEGKFVSYIGRGQFFYKNDNYGSSLQGYWRKCEQLLVPISILEKPGKE